MNILIDSKTPFGIEAFQHLGKVTTAASHEIDNKLIRDKELLVARSETKVNRELLERTRVRFVGTTTIGTDHVDVDYLSSRGIGFASAPGCNANSVKEYVVAALLTLAVRHGFSLKGMTLGIVGVGNIGSKMVGAARALGMEVLQNDPPLQRQTGDPRFVSLDEALKSDIITIHVPLTKQGDATFHLFDENTIGRMRKSAFLINTSRGAVVKTAAIKQALENRSIAGAVLDVWEEEPNIDLELLNLVDIATPHIAGYSFDGKVNAVQMISTAACEFFKCRERWSVPPTGGEIPCPTAVVEKGLKGLEDSLLRTIAQCYDIEKDDERLRDIGTIAPRERGKFFSRLRAEYPLRREFFNTTLTSADEGSQMFQTLRKLGFAG